MYKGEKSSIEVYITVNITMMVLKGTYYVSLGSTKHVHEVDCTK